MATKVQSLGRAEGKLGSRSRLDLVPGVDSASSTLTIMSKFSKAGALAVGLSMLPTVYSQGIPAPFQLILNIFKPSLIESPSEIYDGWEFRYGRFVFRPACEYFLRGESL